MIITTENMKYDEIPTGEILARLYAIYDLGYQRGLEDGSPRRELIFLFELDAVKKDGTPYTIATKHFTASMHPKAGLRIFIESWRGMPYVDDEVKHFDTDILIGQCCFLNVVQSAPENGKKPWRIIFSIRGRGATPAFMTRMKPGFIPDWIVKVCEKQVMAPQDMPSSTANCGGAGGYKPPDNRMEF